MTIKRYKLNLMMTFISMLVYLFVISSFSEAISLGENSDFVKYNSNLFLFLLTGLVIIELTISCTTPLVINMSFYQTSSVMEELSVNENRLALLISSSIIVPFFQTFLKALIYSLFGLFFFNLELEFSLVSFLIIPSMMVYCMGLIGIGLAACSFTVIFKRGNPVVQINTMLTVLLGGFIYPSTSLPDLISYLSDLIPGKHMVEITRMVLGSATLEVDTLLVHLFLLLFLSMTLYVSGSYAFKKSVLYAKDNDLLMDY